MYRSAHRKREELQADQSWAPFVATEEYKLVEEMTRTNAFQSVWSETENLYAALHLLSMNRTKDISPLKDDEVIQHLLQEIVEEFERLAFVHLKDKEQLCQQLYVHFKPAYYRLRYGLPQMNPMTGRVQKVYPELHHLTKNPCGCWRKRLAVQYRKKKWPISRFILAGGCAGKEPHWMIENGRLSYARMVLASAISSFIH